MSEYRCKCTTCVKNEDVVRCVIEQKCNMCEVCGCCYPADEGTFVCHICHKKTPLSHCDLHHYDDCKFVMCYEQCRMCDKIICSDHPNQILRCQSGNSRYDINYFCLQCYLTIQIQPFDSDSKCEWTDTYGAQQLLKEQVNKISELQNKVHELQNVLNYMPGGPGFDLAKASFDSMVENYTPYI